MINKTLIKALEAYLLEFQVQDIDVSVSYIHQPMKRAKQSPKMTNESMAKMDYKMPTPASIQLDDFIETNKKPPFQTVLFHYIDLSDLSDSGVYKKAFIDRRLFSKIRSNEAYHPKKTTIISLGLALELPLKDLQDLLKSAGYILNRSDTFDLIIHFCIEESIYNILDVNSLLDHFDQNLL